LIIIADSGLLSSQNISKLQETGYEFILGARIKNEKQAIRDKILSLKLKNAESKIIRVWVTQCRKQVIRFHATLNKILSSLSQNQSLDFAFEHGYFDQAHFINDFKYFSGYTPKHFFKENPSFRFFQF
jgi:AraC-like DNA-binding protein